MVEKYSVSVYLNKLVKNILTELENSIARNVGVDHFSSLAKSMQFKDIVPDRNIEFYIARYDHLEGRNVALRTLLDAYRYRVECKA